MCCFGVSNLVYNFFSNFSRTESPLTSPNEFIYIFDSITYSKFKEANLKMLIFSLQKICIRRLNFLNEIQYPLKSNIDQHPSIMASNIKPCILEMIALIEQIFIFLIIGHYDRHITSNVQKELNFLKLEMKETNWIQLPFGTEIDSFYNKKLEEMMVTCFFK
jgi:hypothetical protein